MKKYGKDLTNGSVPSNLLKFAIPVFLANLLSSGYGIINTIWVGHLLGGLAVAAVAVTFPLILLMVALANSSTMASSVLIAQNFGAKRNDQVQKIVNTSWTFSILLILIFVTVTILSVDRILNVMQTTEEVKSAAKGYICLMILQFSLLYISFLVGSILRAIGDSKIPLMFTILGVLINALLDPFLMTGYGPFPKWGIMGAAAASLIAGGIATLSALQYVYKKYRHSPIIPNRLEFDFSIVKQIAGIGFPSFVQQTILSVAIAFMTAYVNRFGADATAAFGIASRFDGLIVMPAIAVMVAVSTVTAQSIGANKVYRISELYRWGIIINTPMILLMSLLSIAAPSFVMHLFVRDEHIISIGVHYFQIVGWAYLFLIPLYVTNGVILGSKKAIISMIFSFVSLGGIRIPFGAILSHSSLGISGVWIATFMSFVVNATLGYIYYRSGKWKPKEITPIIRENITSENNIEIA